MVHTTELGHNQSAFTEQLFPQFTYSFNALMPTVLRRLNQLFRRNSNETESDPQTDPQNISRPNELNQEPAPIRRHQPRNNQPRRRRRRLSHSSRQSAPTDPHTMLSAMPIELKSSGYKRSSDGSVTLSVTLDKDQVECCVCLSAMSSKIYRCRGSANPRSDGRTKIVCHNICRYHQYNFK